MPDKRWVWLWLFRAPGQPPMVHIGRDDQDQESTAVNETADAVRSHLCRLVLPYLFALSRIGCGDVLGARLDTWVVRPRRVGDVYPGVYQVPDAEQGHDEGDKTDEIQVDLTGLPSHAEAPLSIGGLV